MKKIISVLLTFIMILSVSPITALAEAVTDSVDLGVDKSDSGFNDVCVWSYDADTKTMTIDGENIVSQNDDDSELLPTYSVDENGNKHYAYRGFETLVLGEHVQRFYAAANADNYPNLRTFDMSRSAVSELTGALCSSAVTSLILPHNLKTIDEGALFELNIEKIDIPSTVESIGNEAFMSSGLKSVTFGESEIAFGDNVFAECAALETVDLSKVTFAKTETNEAGTVPAGMFKNCTSLSAINISNAKAVGDNAFNGCSALSKIIRNSDAEISIGNYAFNGTSALNDTVFNNVTSLGDYALSDSSVKSVIYNGKSTPGEGAFNHAKNLSSVVINNISTIPYGFFYGAKADSVIIGSSVTSIGQYAFTSAVINNLTFETNHLTKIFGNAFNSMTYTNEEPLKLPAKIDEVLSQGFKNFNGEIDFSCVHFGLLGDRSFLSAKISIVEDVKIDKMGNDVFKDCTNLQYFSTDSSYRADATYGKNVFLNCTNLKEVYDYGVKKLYANAFDGCTSLQVFASESLSAFNSTAFNGCTSLEAVGLGNVTTIPDNAFSDCPNLRYVEYNKTYLDYIGINAFKGCSKLDSIDLSLVEDIESGAFSGCSSLDFSSLPGTHIIGANAFEGCTSLTSIELGEYLDEVGENAFKDCVNLENVTFSPTSITFGENIFDGCNSLKWLKFRGYTYTMPTSFFTKIPDGFSFYCGKSTTPEAYANKNNIPVNYLSTEYPIEDYKHGTLDNGKWEIVDSTINIYGEGSGELGNVFYYSDKTTTTLHDIVSRFNITNVKLLGNITSIPDNFMENMLLPNMTSLDIPSTVKSIGNYAFYNLRSSADQNAKDACFDVNLPESLEFVGEYAFCKVTTTKIDTSKCVSDNIVFSEGAFCAIKYLSEFAVPSGVKQIPKKLFYNDYYLSSVTLTNQEEIGDYAFYSTAIKEITLPESVKSVGRAAFTGCKNLTLITVKSADTQFVFESIISSGNSAGYDANGARYNSLTIKCDPISKAHEYAVKALVDFECIKLNYESTGYVTDIKYGSNTARWYYYPDENMLLISGNSVVGGKFYDENYNPIKFDNIDTIRFYDDVTSIGRGWDAVNPKHVYFSDRLNSITYAAFEGCKNLVALNIPDSVTLLGEYAFEGCTGLKSVTVGKGVQNIPQFCFKNCIALQDLNLLGTVSISSAAFVNCSKLVTLNLPDTLKTINSNAFINCYSIVKITFGKNLRLIDEYAFANLPFCDEINFNSNVNIKNNAFYNTGLSTTGITVNFLDNAMMVSLDGFADTNVAVLKLSKNFSGFIDYGRVPQLRDITVDDGNVNGYTSYQHALYKDKTLVLAPQNVKTLQIRNDTEKIAANALRYNSLSIAVLPDGLTEISDDAFADSSTLKAVKFPKTVEKIGNRAFASCPKIKTINIPDSLISIGERAFYNCTSLAAVVLPEGLSEIKSECFNGCRSIVSMVIPRSVTNIGGGAFSNMTSLEKIYIWNSNSGYRMLYNSNKAVIYTLAGTPAYEFARNNKYDVKGYTDEEVFAEECFAAVNSLEGYLGYCTDGHGDIEWLTVYEPDCENDGYRIGVCEYCSTILKEEHITAKGHKYQQIGYIKETATQRGIRVLKCTECGETRTTYTNPTSSTPGTVGVYNVSGIVQADTKRSAYYGENFGIENANIVIDGNVVARTDEYGRFSFNIKSGSYMVDIVYNFGFTRTVGLTVSDGDVIISEPIKIVACDFNKDKKIDSADQNLFRIIVSSKKGDPAYLSYVDLNHDGYINAKDYLIIQSFDGIDAYSYIYPELNLA
ncbi:leucine-rich repeat protein [uncultured Eubacterium sp.]|uniref:leucine-rich repeat protein n=1 Tax=uncultured Eubacterium sp. TaxID=165185 RepID=UPI0026274631|nr:leucine-rich repeat protein [uncultured Eubacterium sp.]